MNARVVEAAINEYIERLRQRDHVRADFESEMARWVRAYIRMDQRAKAENLSLMEREAELYPEMIWTRTGKSAMSRDRDLAEVVDALPAAIEIMKPTVQPEALKTCATMASDIADNLEKLTRSAA
ncbi:hypothetical protein [Janthinobacterium agaricidamnosum]|nr:hypothetical protein [Janthinobacterium agaricidamnosum]